MPEVRLIGIDGEQIGIVGIESANKMAEDAEVDLVEIAPLAKPPVCRLMDYGKFKYRESKKRHEAKLKQKQIQVKEVKFRPRTDDADYKIKVRNLIRFLKEGDKTKVTLRFRGREMAHQELGAKLLERVKADLEADGIVEQFPKMEGRQMVMVVAPRKKLGKGEKPEKPEKVAKAPKAEKADKPQKVEKVAKAEKVEKPDRKAAEAPKTAS